MSSQTRVRRPLHSLHPRAPLDAYRDHGNPEVRIEQNVNKAYEVLGQLAELGIDIDQVTRRLEKEGDEKFAEPFDKLIRTLEKVLPKHSDSN